MSDPRRGGKALDRIRVLIVDDDDDARDLLSAVLDQHGASVVLAASADEAFEVLRRAPPDVLVSDIAMPVQDGFGLIARVRALTDREGGSTPAVAVTAFAAPTDRHRALSAGFDDWLPKPIDHDALVRKIAELDARRRGRDA